MHVKPELLISLSAKKRLSLEGMSLFQKCGGERVNVKDHECNGNDLYFQYKIHCERKLLL